jgi:hypothetical protein
MASPQPYSNKGMLEGSLARENSNRSEVLSNSGSGFNLLENPTGNKMLDELERGYKLRQDMERSDDLESEERALANLMAQEYDAIKLLSAIPEHSELYKFKLAQFKKLSEVRGRAELVLQD